MSGPDMVVLHYTGMATAAAALERLCDPTSEVSAHYLIDEAGRIWTLVAEDRRAWHAGRSAWGGVTDVNSHSVGIELANPGLEPGAHPFPHPQMQALEALLGGILVRHAIPPERVVGHACVAPGRKVDPGPRFDWRRLARMGLGVWPDRAETRSPGPAAAGQTADAAARFRRAGRAFGYPLAAEGGWNAEAKAVWRAFADRFAPRLAAAPGAGEGLTALESLAARWPAALDPEAGRV